MEAEAYTLREWFAFLANHGKHWTEASDLLMRKFRQNQKTPPERHRTAKRPGVPRSKQQALKLPAHNQIEKKLRRVFDFYRLIPAAIKFDERSQPVGEFVGPPASQGGSYFPITLKDPKLATSDRQVWSGAKDQKRNTTKPTILSDGSVSKVYEALRNRSGVTDGQGLEKLKGDRDWLMAYCMTGAGLRAAEVAGFLISSLENALRKEGVIDRSERILGRRIKLTGLSKDAHARDAILESLKNFKINEEREFVYVEILGKGDKLRSVPFEVGLISDLITVGLWEAEDSASGVALSRAGPFFQSYKTGRALTAGAVSDIIKSGFRNAHVTGSGHSLRKVYATKLASAVLRRSAREHGQLTQGVINTVLSDVADALGHDKVTTTIKHYVDLAIIQFTGIADRRKRQQFLKILTVIEQEEVQLTDANILLIANVIRVLSNKPDSAPLAVMINKILADPRLNPTMVLDETAPPRHLRLVSKPDNDRPTSDEKKL
ncbi:hypothetical protein [Rhizobium laguerreae]|uniref:hypothetical protein n=1 Tax=Rhizobium laguerreae TaxID=1076926 RepID=UPI001C8FECB4|nr:hypothetical protein [Rhizobium laguerreae]MBY3198043.1 hypothetical protein [Rhizobium laguerreae]